MSEAYKCDRCGKLYEPYNGFDIATGQSTLQVKGIRLIDRCDRIGSVLDLCPDCMLFMKNWLENPTDMPEPVEESYTGILEETLEQQTHVKKTGQYPSWYNENVDTRG